MIKYKAAKLCVVDFEFQARGRPADDNYGTTVTERYPAGIQLKPFYYRNLPL